jgi:uncharacterized cupredoxin-like copper-binding protein
MDDSGDGAALQQGPLLREWGYIGHERRAGTHSDSLLVLCTGLACGAMFIALVAIGLGARAVSSSKTELRAAQATLSAVTAKAAAAAPAAPPSPGAAAASPTPAAPSGPAPVTVSEKDFAIAPSTPVVPAGLVDFTVNNNGPSEHEFLVFKTDLVPDKLPLGKDSRVDETADGATKVFDSGNNIGVAGSKTFHAALTAGTYVLVCNLPGHYLAGMHTAFTVTAPLAPPVAVATAEKDFAISPATTTAKAGLVDFTVTNNGPAEHEFLIFQTDLAPDKLPVGPDGRVSESADGATKVFDSGNNIPVAGSKTFSTALLPGHYVLVCNLPGGHYLAGMHTAFTVTG